MRENGIPEAPKCGRTAHKIAVKSDENARFEAGLYVDANSYFSQYKLLYVICSKRTAYLYWYIKQKTPSTHYIVDIKRVTCCIWATTSHIHTKKHVFIFMLSIYCRFFLHQHFFFFFFVNACTSHFAFVTFIRARALQAIIIRCFVKTKMCWYLYVRVHSMLLSQKLM